MRLTTLLTQAWRRLGIFMLVTVTCGACATSEVVVPIDVGAIASRRDGVTAQAQVHVQVTDLRKSAQMERTTVGNVSMGTIRLEPAAPDLVQALVTARAESVLARRGAGEAMTVTVGIREFDVVTPATVLYWDVRARIALVVRLSGQDREVSTVASERTYVWPSQDLVARVSLAALRQIGAEIERAIDELLPAAP
jgi:hypothetical protein